MASSQSFKYNRSRYSPCICGIRNWTEAELSLKRPKFLPGERNSAPEPATTEGGANDHSAHLSPQDSNHSLVFPIPDTETENIWNYYSGLIRQGMCEYRKCKATIMQVWALLRERSVPHLLWDIWMLHSKYDSQSYGEDKIKWASKKMKATRKLFKYNKVCLFFAPCRSRVFFPLLHLSSFSREGIHRFLGQKTSSFAISAAKCTHTCCKNWNFHLLPFVL